LRRDRYRAARQRLQENFAAALRSEYRDKYLADYQRVEARRNAAAEKLARTRELQAQIIAAFIEAEEVDKEIDRLHGDAPDDVSDRLRSVELFARDLVNFTSDNVSLVKSTQFFDWKTGAQIWPPKQPSFAATYAASMAFPSHARGISGPIGEGWETEEMRERFRQLGEQDRAAMTAYYVRETEKEEQRKS
jgi:hypothetical protein